MTSMPALSDLEPDESGEEREAWREEAQPDGGLTVAVAESCTGGMLAASIVETPGSGEWFKGALVAYDPEVKFRLLQIPEGPVITREAGMDMASGVRELMEADIGVGTTGVAGPDTEEGQPVGTVFVGLADGSGTQAVLLSLEGSPDEIRQAATRHALQQVLHMRGGSAPQPKGGPRALDLRYELAIPEGGFAIVSPDPLDVVSIIGSDVSFRIPGNGSDPVIIEIVGLDGLASPDIVLTQTGAEPISPGATGALGHRVFELSPGTTVGITWSKAHLALA